MFRKKFLSLPGTFRDKRRWEGFLEKYSLCTTYWYVPKAKVINDSSLEDIKKRLYILFNNFLEEVWTRDTQMAYHKRLVEEGLVCPRADKKEATKGDITALERINKIIFELLGFAWINKEDRVMLTDAGLNFLSLDKPRRVVENQVTKMQWPVPERKDSDEWGKIIPYLFLLQVLQKSSYYLSEDEYQLFVNLAKDQEDITEVVDHIQRWRRLTENEQKRLLEKVKKIPMPKPTDIPLFEKVRYDTEYSRFRRIKLDLSYQRALWSYPRGINVEQKNGKSILRADVPNRVNETIEKLGYDLYAIKFDTLEDWFEYYGNPDKKPSWFDALNYYIEKSPSTQEAKTILKTGRKEKLTNEQKQELEDKVFEKQVEDFYVKSLNLLEEGLRLHKKHDKDGRQYPTQIGRIDLLCKDRRGDFVVIEIKRGRAEDKTIGQTLRYIGWVYQHLCKNNTVRGMILAGRFPEKIMYARIGLLKGDYREFLQFKKYKIEPETV